ncbi:RND family efflux transporter MFP subunit [Sulfitobacter undariae]|uniref:RND family efflux transporter MFP subunit n=1 Tax=Sulfitobacter undariae TaxID=1563671 RepID=A0A7W6E4R5_9RHOB|nr:efflux RND transporter periplasmic adaptor subunit [Sulfitobacter undariae]MBB3993416.1 RND family efflux transporter MFP subunit [Sulfitobacter undariae]
MRMLGTLLAVVVILAGSYYVSFGMPAPVADLLGVEQSSASNPDAGASGAQRGARGAGGGGRGATVVVTSPVEMAPYEDVMRAVGSAAALRSVNVVTEVSGAVIETNLSANREVVAGEVLVKLDARTEALNLEIAQAELEQAQSTFQRYERLGSSGNSTITDVAKSEANVAQRLAEAKVGLAEIALEERTIRAPISGRLGLSDLMVGDILAANSVIGTIDDSEVLLVEFELPERSIGMLTPEQRVLASTPTLRGRTFEGEIVEFDSRIDSVTRSVTVKMRVDNSDGLLWPGMTFSVRINHQSAPMSVLPSTAITWSRSGSSVWVDNEGKAEQVPVTIVFRRDDQVWIDADIAVGAMVVTEGALKLRAGASITSASRSRTPKEPS